MASDLAEFSKEWRALKKKTKKTPKHKITNPGELQENKAILSILGYTYTMAEPFTDKWYVDIFDEKGSKILTTNIKQEVIKDLAEKASLKIKSNIK